MMLRTMPYRSSSCLSLPTLVIALGLCAGLVACGSGGGNNAGPVGSQPTPPPPPPLQHAYIASTGDDKIYIYDFNPSTGKLTANGTVPTGSVPQQIAFHPSHQLAYVANSGSHNISMYKVNPTTGALTPLEDPGNPGAPLPPVHVNGNPTDIAVDPLGRFAYTANEAGISVSSFRIDPTTGALSPIETVPVGISDSTETFSVTVDPTGSFVYATVGDGILPSTANAIHAFSIDPTTGKLADLGTTSAPAIAVHVTVHPDKTKPFVYLASGIDHMVTSFKMTTPNGPLTEVNRLDTAGSAARAVAVEHSGKFAYVANVGTHTVTAFSINQTSGALASLDLAYPVPNGGGRFLAIDPSGQFLYATSDAPASSVTVFHIDSKTGELTELDTATSAGKGSIGVAVIEAP